MPAASSQSNLYLEKYRCGKSKMKHDMSHDPILEISLHYGEIQIEKYTIKRSLSGFSNCFLEVLHTPR